MDVSKHVLVISHDVVGAQMAGPGIRYYHLARVLAREFPVTLAVPTNSTLTTEFTILTYSSGRDPVLEDAIRNARVVVAPALWLAQSPAIVDSQVPLVVDGYDPYVAETLLLHPDAVSHQQTDLTQAYLAGDFFICASERQRDWWLGILEANGRINPYTYGEDRSLRRLVDVVPFGLPETSPQHTRQTIKGVWQGIGEQDRVILWGGGLWPWLDPLTAIRAVARVWRKRQDVRLIFPGTRHPNPWMAEIPTHNRAARELAVELGLLDKAVFFGDWIAYDDWQNVLLESDIALTLHGNETLEARLAFRSRVFDYIWAGLPIIATRGDATSELIAQYQVGVTVAPHDTDAVAAAILQLLDTPREAWHARFERARHDLTWERAARPLIEFCRQPRRAADKVAMGAQLGNPFYVEKMVRLQREHTQLRAERDAAQALVRAYERRRVVRFANGLVKYLKSGERMIRKDFFCRLVHHRGKSIGSGEDQEIGDTLFDVTGSADQIDLTTLDVIRWAPAWMTRGERLLLFALIFALRPLRYLEIGTFQGGSALIVTSAMDASGSQGRIVCVDPHPQISSENWKRIEHRAILLQGHSPGILSQAAQVAGGTFDFVLIDGDHTVVGVSQDAYGVLPFLAKGGYLLFHDAYFSEIAYALNEFTIHNADHVVDLGYLSREVTTQTSSSGTVRWGGLRLMRRK